MPIVDLTNPRAKVGRGQEHLERLHNEVDAFRATIRQPVIEWEPTRIEFEGEEWNGLVCTRIVHSPPFALGLIAGDAGHNFRSALDHLAVALVEANRKEPGRGTSFPIYASRPADERSKKRLGANLARMAPEARKRIREMQPFVDPSHPRSEMLVALSWLDNTDKHRLVPPAISLSDGTEIRVTPESRERPPVWFQYGVPLEPGAVLLRWRPDDPAVDDVEIVSFDMSVGFGGAEKGVTLRNLAQIAEGVLDIVESFDGFSAP